MDDSESNMNEHKYTLTLEDRKYLIDNGKYSETDDVRTKSLQDLQAWLQENPHIGANTNEYILLRFLRQSKYRMDKCKKIIANFYLYKAQVPEWFKQRDLSQTVLKEYLSLGPFLPLRTKDTSKRTTILIRPTVHDPSIVSQNNMMKLMIMVLDRAMELDETISIYGVHVVVDLRNVKLGHVLTPDKIKKAVYSWQDCYPISPKRFDFIFAPKFIDFALDLMKRFMSSKLRSRVHVHGKNLGSLHEHVSPEILPKEYGGTAGPVKSLIDFWEQEVLKAKDWFIDDEKYCTELTKQNRKNKFKLLEID